MVARLSYASEIREYAKVSPVQLRRRLQADKRRVGPHLQYPSSPVSKCPERGDETGSSSFRPHSPVGPRWLEPPRAFATFVPTTTLPTAAFYLWLSSNASLRRRSRRQTGLRSSQVLFRNCTQTSTAQSCYAPGLLSPSGVGALDGGDTLTAYCPSQLGRSHRRKKTVSRTRGALSTCVCSNPRPNPPCRPLDVLSTSRRRG